MTIEEARTVKIGDRLIGADGHWFTVRAIYQSRRYLSDADWTVLWFAHRQTDPPKQKAHKPWRWYADCEVAPPKEPTHEG